MIAKYWLWSLCLREENLSSFLSNESRNNSILINLQKFDRKMSRFIYIISNQSNYAVFLLYALSDELHVIQQTKKPLQRVGLVQSGHYYHQM